MLKLFCIIGSLAAVVGLSLAIDAESHSKPREIDASKPGVSNEVHAPGRVEGATEQIDLRLQLFGRVEETLVSEGQTVEAGEVLIRLDGMQQQHECAAAEAGLAAAEAEHDRLVNGARAEERREAAADVDALAAQLESTRQRLLRISKLRDRGASTAQELDDLKAEVKSLEAQMESAQARRDLVNAPARDEDLRLARARVKTARAQLDVVRNECSRAALSAPSRGRVLKVNVRPGELTGPESSEPALILADASRMHVRAYVDEFDAPRVRLETPARITADGLPETVFRGRVVRLAPLMTQKPLRTDDPLERFDTKAREVWIELEPPATEKLIVGLPVDVVLELNANAATDWTSESGSVAFDEASSAGVADRESTRSPAAETIALPAARGAHPLRCEAP